LAELRPRVAELEAVDTERLSAERAGKLGANVHASISGRVEAVTGEHIVISVLSLSKGAA